MSEESKTILVTGGTRGIGRAVCLAAAKQGHDVAFSYASDDAAAESLIDLCESQGVGALAIRSDVGDPDQVAAMFRAVDLRFGRIDGLVNNAGITGMQGQFLDTPREVIADVFRVNVSGMMDCCREAAMRMALSRGGRGGAIVNISSGAARTGAPNAYVWYGAAKAAVESFTTGFAQEVAGDGIRVNCVSPGVTATEIHSRSGRTASLEQLAATIPLKRVAEPEEIADPILYLLSDGASYVVGATLRVGGGR